MANNKSLMENIDKNVSSIRESKFGTKLPSKANEARKNTEQELAYEQMIMGTLASLTWGIKKLSKPTDIRSYFNRANIFEAIKNIEKTTNINKQIFAGLIKNNKIQLNKVIELLQKINIPDNFGNINISNVSLQKETIDEITDNISKKLQNLDNTNNNDNSSLDSIKDYLDSVIFDGRVGVNIHGAQIDKLIEKISDNISKAELNINKTQIDNIIQALSLNKNNSSNKSSTSDININIANLDSLQELINTLSDEQSKMNVFHGISSIIELLTFLDSNDLKDLNNSGVNNLQDFVRQLTASKSQFEKIFETIQDIVNGGKNGKGIGNINADLRSLSLIVDNIIKIISIDPKTINLKGLRYLVRITDPERGLIAKLFQQINDITKGIKLEQNNFIVLGRFFESLVMLADIGFIKRRRIRDNVSFIKKHIIGMIPDIIKKLQKVVDDNQKDAYTAIGNISAIFSALSEMSELNIKKRTKLMINLDFIKNIYINQIVSILEKIQNVSKDSSSAAMALTSINEVIKTILTLSDISFLKIMLISEKAEMLMSVISDKVSSVLESIVKINNINESIAILNDLVELFEYINSIYEITPGLLYSAQQSLKLILLNDIIVSMQSVIDSVNSLNKINTIDIIKNDLCNLIKAIYEVLDNIEKNKLQELNESLLYVNDTLLPNIFSIILSVNSMPKFTNTDDWKSVLKTILKEFDDTEDDSLANILGYKLNKQIIEDISCLSNILICLSNVVSEINNIKEVDEENLNKLLDVTKTIVEQFNEEHNKSLASNFKNINDEDIDKVDTVIKLLEKLSKLNKVKLVLNISEKTIKTIAIIGDPIKKFVETLGSIKDEDLEKANDAINAFFKVAIGGALLLVGIGLLMPFIKIDALVSFTLILSGFLFTLTGIFWLLSKSLKESLKYVKDAMIFVGACSAILLFGALVNKYIDWGDLFGFLFKVGTFMLGIATILWILSALYKGKFMDHGFAALTKMSLLVALASAVMVLATMVYEYVKWDALLGFLGMFALYIIVVGGICALLGYLKKYLVIGAFALLGIMVLTVLAMGVMQLLYLQAKQESYYETIKKGLESMAWVFGSFVAVIAGLGALVGYTGGVGAVVLIAGMATLYAIEEVVEEAAKAMQMIYVALSNFKNLNLEEEDFDRMADMIKGFAMLSVLLVDKIPVKQLLKLQLGGASAINKVASAIGEIARSMKEFATLRIPTGIGPDGKPTGYVTVADSDFSTAQENIGKLITCVVDGVLSVAQTHPELFDVHYIKDSKAMNAAKVVHKMGKALGSIAKGISEFASSKMAIEFDDNGKPTKYVRITAPVMRAAAASIKNVLVCIGSALVTTVKDHPELFEEGTIADSPAMNAAKTLKIMGDVIAGAASAIGGLASGYIPTYDKDGKLNDKKNWLTFKLSDLEKDGPVYKAVDSILTCLGNALNYVVGKEENKWMFDEGMFYDSPAMNAAEAMKNMGDALNSTIDAITKISEIKTEDLSSKIDTMKANIQKAITSVLEVFKIFTNTKDTGIEKEAVKSGFKGFINDAAKFFGGEGKVFETNGSIAQYINDNIDEIKDAGDAIKNITSVISSIISSLSKVGESNNKLQKYKDLFDESSDTKLSTVFAKIMTQLVGVHNSISYQFGNVDLDDRIKKTKELNKLVNLYVDNLNAVVKLGKLAEDTGGEGYNVLRDGILSIYSATSQLKDTITFAQHAQKLQQYVEAINSIKLDKLSSLKGFVESINELSQRLGNLDGLTDAIANKLSVVLFELVSQLRKAEATIENAHVLQDKRKKLMEQSIDKMKNILNQHMIVEIYQGSQEEISTSSTPQGSINNSPVTENKPSEDNTPSDTNTQSLPNPENETAKVTNNKNKNMSDFKSVFMSEDIMTFGKFKTYMEDVFMKDFRNSTAG